MRDKDQLNWVWWNQMFSVFMCLKILAAWVRRAGKASNGKTRFYRIEQWQQQRNFSWKNKRYEMVWEMDATTTVDVTDSIREFFKSCKRLKWSWILNEKSQRCNHKRSVPLILSFSSQTHTMFKEILHDGMSCYSIV